MEEIKKILAYNKQFVEEKRYEQYSASKFPNKKLAIVTCMDTRLVELLPAALGLKNGDVKMIKNAGGVVTSPFGSVIRSLLVAIIELGVRYHGHRPYRLWCPAHRQRDDDPSHERARHHAGIHRSDEILRH